MEETKKKNRDELVKEIETIILNRGIRFQKEYPYWSVFADEVTLKFAVQSPRGLLYSFFCRFVYNDNDDYPINLTIENNSQKLLEEGYKTNIPLNVEFSISDLIKLIASDIATVVIRNIK